MLKDDEIFRDVPGYEGLYQISNYGTLKSLPKKRRLVTRTGREHFYIYPEKLHTGTVDDLGYIHYILTKDGKGHLFKAHSLVAMAFLGYDFANYDRNDIYNSLVVNHIDMDKQNNYVRKSGDSHSSRESATLPPVIGPHLAWKALKIKSLNFVNIKK